MGALFVFVGFMAVLGIVYPVCGVVAYKMCGSKKSVWQIISEL